MNWIVTPRAHGGAGDNIPLTLCGPWLVKGLWEGAKIVGGVVLTCLGSDKLGCGLSAFNYD